MIFLSPEKEEQVQKMIQDVKLLLIDFDGTLVDFEKAEKKALNIFLKKHSIKGRKTKREAVKFYDSVNKELWRKFEKKELQLEEVRHSRFAAVKEKYALEGEPKELDKEYLEYLIKSTKTTKKTLKLLKKLKEKYTLYVITNGIHYVQVERLKKTGIMDLIDGFVTSEEIGAPKPEKEMFVHILKKENIEPEKAFLIGDSYKADILGARKMGIKSCLIIKERKKRKNFEEKEKPTMVGKSFVQWAKWFLSN